AGDEIQLTDAIALLLFKQPVNAFHITGRSHDCGDKMGYLKTFIEYGLREPHLGPKLLPWLKQLMQQSIVAN
ncbi:MAG TPA: UTP--glucose-1-phosphate uridylyltransferase, partial [Rheinheimera sp.]|nr:UTP--glucose-1-phosphate uridylyltransferase [Rheinheimera sp.]